MAIHGSLRRHAFERLAVLSAKQAAPNSKATDLPRLCSLYQRPENQNGANRHNGQASKGPMGTRELEVLLALCRAAPLVQNEEHAECLLRQIGPYLSQAYTQTFRHSPSLRSLQPSPWEIMVRDVAAAVLAIGANHIGLKDLATSYVRTMVDGLLAEGKSIVDTQARTSQEDTETDVQHAARTVRFSVSVLGFLTALADKADAVIPSHRFTMIRKLQSLLSERFMVAFEGTLSSVRNSSGQDRAMREWKRMLKQYAIACRPLGAIILQHAFMHFVASCSALLITNPLVARHPTVLDVLINSKVPPEILQDDIDDTTLEALATLNADSIALLDADADFLQVSSAWQQRIAFSLKASSLTAYLCCSLVNEEIADADVLMTWLESVISSPIQLADDELAQTTMKCFTILAKTSKSFASSLGRSLPRLIVQSKMTSETSAVAADCLARILLLLPQDMRISTLYSLGNVLSVGADPTRTNPSLFFDGSPASKASLNQYSHANGSAISLVTGDAEETASVHGTVVDAVVRITRRSNDDKITTLALSMLVQKISRVSMADDIKLIQASAELALSGSPNDLRPLLRLHSRMCHDALVKDNSLVLQAVMNARLTLAKGMTKDSPLYETYLVYLLDSTVSISGTTDTEGGPVLNASLGSEEIAQLLRPLALLVSHDPAHEADFEDPDRVRLLSRDSWFNLVAHNFTVKSNSAIKYINELQTLAWYSPSIVDNDRADSQDGGIELNTVLRRNKNAEHTAYQKQALINAFPAHESDIKSLDYAELTFLNAANLIATLRARAGDCTRTMEYFNDSKFKSGSFSNCLFAISMNAIDQYLNRTWTGTLQQFAAPELARQLVIFFQGSCHRIAKVQHVAISAADRIISQVPSALCQRTSLFALLELLSLMWTACLEGETDEYDWRSDYFSSKGNVSLHLSDDFAFRRATLANFQKRCRAWVTKVIDIAPLDMMGLLQTYLSDYEDDGAFGHISLGRSFAVEMGCLVPSTDQRLGAIGGQRELGLNSASDFIAQYTTRQEYRAIDPIASVDEGSVHMRQQGRIISDRTDVFDEVQDVAKSLREIHERIETHQETSSQEIRTALRRAAAVLCKTDVDRAGLVHNLVAIPFALFTKHFIKLGISLWMGLLRENSKLESRVLTEVAMCWEASVRKRRGIFSSGLHHPDPFYLKEEFAPTDRDALVRRQQHTHDIIAPHFRLVQFLSSHFSATRLCSPSQERIFFRLARVSLAAMRDGAAQPLAREVHFQIILLALRILMYSTSTDDEAKWTLKDQILTAGLLWFKLAPRWSFGSNKLQLKAEVRLIADVMAALKIVAGVGSRPIKSLQTLVHKQQLLLQLLESESQRLNVWLSPLDRDGGGGFLSGHAGTKLADTAILPLIPVAWAESPELAIQMAIRYPSPRLSTEIRSYLLKYPHKALDEPEALQFLLGPTLPKDVQYQLRYLLYWAPVNPITAVAYFLPAYGNHPLVIQYAVRALESHSVDVTFFYVPQIVQTLRYDVLGYVERYIIETAKFSQLFAHQIIWNIKANAYKDEDSQIPDPVKPTLDKVMDELIASFSVVDKDFYEREFEFFSKVTGISGTLKPFIKRPKPEKKAKIEEELRKIEVDVGVYLPSNPDGVIIGIDRKSGKPLQSHAKAPYMATFRIRKEKSNDLEAVDEEIDRSAEKQAIRKDNTYEVWQSAIFKVGDDCRQDVLALQMIAAFRGIFNNVGLDVYVFPYRVTATAPGCGVIDVLPNSISRDMLGREQVNGLYEYFVTKYGGEDSLRFQAARNNFVKSMAAYSVISYLLQFKDRHNGNIMVDDAGHILHIDFGFCFDIAPGGVRFERAPFKLTSEMVAVMGGSTESQPYHWFEELCVKAFLASRPYAEKLAHMVVVMLDSGLPCFKPETVQHFKERFVLDKSEREAAEFMRFLVRKSEGALSTRGYDQFQLLTNGIPY